MVAGILAVASLGCCGPKGSCGVKAAVAEKQTCCCKEALKGLDLAAEQQAKVDEILSACSTEGCSPEACKKTSRAIRKVLNDEQKVAYAAALEKMADTKGCN
jgi:hypothetical protein